MRALSRGQDLPQIRARTEGGQLPYLGALFIFAVLVVSASAMAKDLPAPDTDPCGDNANQSRMNNCDAVQFKHADDTLNASYSQLIRRLRNNEPAVAMLRQSERAWLVYRDKYCAFEAAASEGGSAQPMVAATCLIPITRARTAELDFQLNCPEGDLACVR